MKQLQCHGDREKVQATLSQTRRSSSVLEDWHRAGKEGERVKNTQEKD
jgi:hypothetical protein